MDRAGHFAQHQTAIGADPSLARFHDNNAWLNTLLLPRPVVDALPHVLAVWLRNCLAGWALYYAVGALWCAAIYWVWGRYFFPNAADKPSWDAILTQMQVRGGGRCARWAKGVFWAPCVCACPPGEAFRPCRAGRRRRRDVSSVTSARPGPTRHV